jgi:hypothetical protein
MRGDRPTQSPGSAKERGRPLPARSGGCARASPFLPSYGDTRSLLAVAELLRRQRKALSSLADASLTLSVTLHRNGCDFPCIDKQ